MDSLDLVGHYCSIESALKILSSGKVRFSPMSHMNDPWESVKRQFVFFERSIPSPPPVEALANALNTHLKFFCASHNWQQSDCSPHITDPWMNP